MGWEGTNLRFQLVFRRHMEHFFDGRFSYYRHLCRTHKQISNPEQFEYKLADHEHMKICNVSPDELPVYAAPHVNNQSYCITQMELVNSQLGLQCIPSYVSLHKLPVPLCA
jgi:hypothetical protein